MIKGFRDFLLRGNVVDLAVAVIIGTAFGLVVKSLTDDVIMQIIALIGGTPDFNDVAVTISDTPIRIGAFITSVINFTIVALVVYCVVVIPMGKVMDKFKTQEPIAKPTRECPECESSIPETAKRCAFCTAEVGPAAAAA